MSGEIVTDSSTSGMCAPTVALSRAFFYVFYVYSVFSTGLAQENSATPPTPEIDFNQCAVATHNAYNAARAAAILLLTQDTVVHHKPRTRRVYT